MTPERLTLARMRRGMSKIDLSRATGIKVNRLYMLESGRSESNDEEVELLSSALHFPWRFFFRPPVELPYPPRWW